MLRLVLGMTVYLGTFQAGWTQNGVPEYRIDDIPYAPQTIRVDACGRSVGLDPRWRLTPVNEKDTRGRIWQGVESAYGRAEALAYFNHPIIKGTITPSVWVTVECAADDWSPDEAKARADRVAAYARKQAFRHIKTRRHRLGGKTWHGVEYLTNRKGKPWVALQSLFSVQDGKLHRVTLTQTTSCIGISGLLRSNQTHEVEVDGETYRGRFGDAKVLVGNTVCSQRTHGQNVKLFNTIRRTLR